MLLNWGPNQGLTKFVGNIIRAAQKEQALGCVNYYALIGDKRAEKPYSFQ